MPVGIIYLNVLSCNIGRVWGVCGRKPRTMNRMEANLNIWLLAFFDD